VNDSGARGQMLGVDVGRRWVVGLRLKVYAWLGADTSQVLKCGGWLDVTDRWLRRHLMAVVRHDFRGI